MECAICGQERIHDELKVFSYGAYTKILSLLKTDCETINKLADPPGEVPIHICMECLKSTYQYSK